MTSTLQSPATRRLAGLDLLRGFAILYVVLFHYSVLFPHPEWLTDLVSFGWTGVDLFFALSGYLIASQLFEGVRLGRELSFRDFFLKRFFRIIPAYLVVLSAYFMFPGWHEREALAPGWKYLTFTQNLGLDARTMGTFSHAWSLCVEEQFYLFFPLIIIGLIHLRKLRHGYIILLALFLTGFALRYFAYTTMVEPFKESELFYPRWYEYIYYPTYSRLDGLLSGIAVAGIMHFRPNWHTFLERFANLFLIAGIALLVGGYYLSKDQHSLTGSMFSFPVVDLGSGLLVLGAVLPGSLLYHAKSSFMSWVAMLSYSIYLIHKMTIHIAQGMLERLGLVKETSLVMLISLLFTALIAYLLYRSVEQPFLKLRHKLLGRAGDNRIPRTVPVKTGR